MAEPILRSEGLFTATGVKPVMIRIYEEEGRFRAYVRHVFKRLIAAPDSKIVGIIGPLSGEPYHKIEDAKRDSKTFVETNLFKVFGRRYEGEVFWDDDENHLRLLPPW